MPSIQSNWSGASLPQSKHSLVLKLFKTTHFQHLYDGGNHLYLHLNHRQKKFELKIFLK